MKNIIKTIFPLNLHITILQLVGYSSKNFLKWIIRNPLRRSLPQKRGVKYTLKAKIILALYPVLLASISLFTYILTTNLLLTVFAFFVFSTQPFLLLIMINLPLGVYQKCLEQKTLSKVNKIISSNKNIRVVGITGSFGKTSTKEILYQFTNRYFRALKTPESYNTVLGIAKVFSLEYDNKYDLFICEMGAFKKGEIKRICQMVPPSYGVITGITPQHLERFGSLENIIKAKFELFEAVGNAKNFVFNLDSPEIRREIKRRKITDYFSYGLAKKNNPDVTAKKISFDKHGSTFTLLVENKKYKVNTRLFGYSNISNILAAFSLALKLGIKAEVLTKKIEMLEPIPHRLELITKGQTTLVDNTYSSNQESFLETLKTAKRVTGRKVLITPGLVELGNLEDKVHKKLGREAKDIFDYIVLVGNNSRTQSFFSGLGKKIPAVFIEDNRKSYLQKISELINSSYDWVFMENDLTEDYQ